MDDLRILVGGPPADTHHWLRATCVGLSLSFLLDLLRIERAVFCQHRIRKPIMLHPVDSTHPVEPTIARMTEEAAKQKALATTEKRELAGDDAFEAKHLDNVREAPIAVLENPLQVCRLSRFRLFFEPSYPRSAAVENSRCCSRALFRSLS